MVDALFGGMLRRLACRIRPYERVPGNADQALEEGLGRYEEAFRHGLPKLEITRQVTVPDRPEPARSGEKAVRSAPFPAKLEQ